MVVCKQTVLRSRPVEIVAASHFEVKTVEVSDALNPGQLFIQTLYLSMDPAVRLYISERKTYWAQVPIGGVMPAIGVGRVLKSASEKYQTGDVIRGMLTTSEYLVLHEKDVWAKVPSKVNPVSELGVFGVHGLTARVGLVDFGKVTPRSTVLVSVAAGATGSAAVQVARAIGCRVVGIVGREWKREYVLRQLGAASCINYSTTPDLVSALKEACPSGVDCYFDLAGGPFLEAALEVMNPEGRVVLCGAISGYDRSTELPVRNFGLIAKKRLQAQGYIIAAFPQYYKEAIKDLYRWKREGKLVSREQLLPGIESVTEALPLLYRGDNIGKVIIEVQPNSPKL